MAEVRLNHSLGLRSTSTSISRVLRDVLLHIDSALITGCEVTGVSVLSRFGRSKSDDPGQGMASSFPLRAGLAELLRHERHLVEANEDFLFALITEHAVKRGRLLMPALLRLDGKVIEYHGDFGRVKRAPR